MTLQINPLGIPMTDAGPNNSNNTPSALKPVAAEERVAKSVNWNPERITAFSTTVIALATLASVAATGLSAIVSYRQWMELKEATEVSRAQAEASRAANIQAATALSTTIDATKKQARAYLVFDKPLLDFVTLPTNAKPNEYYIFDLTNDSNAVITLKNIGATPAYQVVRAAHSILIKAPVDKIPQFAPSASELLSAAEKEKNGYILGTQENDVFPADFAPITKDTNADFRAHKLFYLTQMYAYYRDVFGEPHYTIGCWLFGGDAAATRKGGYFSINVMAGCREEVN
jgi:hypothetical protein